MIVVLLLAMAAGFAGMVVASRAAVDSAVQLVAGSRMPPFFIGMTVLAIGTDLPEIANSIVASAADHGDVNVGDSVGSTATQATLVLGLLPFFVGSMLVTARGLAATGWLVVAGLGTIALVTNDGMLARTDALVLISLWALGSFVIYRRIRHPHQLSLPEEPSPRLPLVIRTVVALGFVGASAMLALWAIIEVAEELDVPEFAVSFFLASLGTSLPEMVFTIAAVKRGEVDLAIGDILGSSFADATLSIATGPLLFPTAVTTSETRPAILAAMAAIAVATVLITRIREHDWRSGSLLIALYGGFFFILL